MRNLNDQFDFSKLSGISEKEAVSRLRTDGYNELPRAKKRKSLSMIFEIAREPMFLLLVVCGAIYFLLGDLHEASLLISFVLVVIGITFYQERKTERALEALRDLSSPRALVIRDGRLKRIAGREVVRGDIISLNEGDRIPADALLVSSLNLCVDESLLTGESAPVRKVARQKERSMERPGGDDTPFVYSGTLIVQGQGFAEVKAIGAHTEIGRIGKALQTVETEKTLLQTETGRLVRNLALVGLFFCGLLVFFYYLTQGGFVDGLLAGITLAMATIPEEFPMVVTIFLALGAWRISKKQVLTRRIPAVETLGSASVLCTDKTGTITLNRMSIARIFSDGKYYDVSHPKEAELPEYFHRLIEFGILASQQSPFDPMDKAIKQLGEQSLSNTEHLHEDWRLVREYPLSQDLLALSHVWELPDGQDLIIASKGAPEAIIDLCHLEEGEKQAFSRHIRDMADDGLRVIGVARATFAQRGLPEEQHLFNFQCLGLIGLADPVRPNVPDSVKECTSAGIRVVMITGDYPDTAQNIARQIGLHSTGKPITGPELDTMDDHELEKHIKNTSIFARVVPEQKLRLVKALKANGEIVAMTGDGVNDAPALKSAHIGIAMGGRGTDVAREASSLVLLDDDFSSIVDAIKMGRRIFDNLKKAMAYIFAVHVPIVGMSLIPVLWGWPLVLFPVHIVFLELIIDPACSTVFEAEPEEEDVMRRPPRDPGKSLFGLSMIGLSLFQGLMVLLIVFAVFYISMNRGQNELEARALTFSTMIIANLGLIFTNRTWSRTIFSSLRSPNSALWWVCGGTLLFLGLVLYIPFLRHLFRLAFLHPIDLVICLAAGLASILWFEGLKVVNRKLGKPFFR
jgi:P-type Ca2+ transporter type 2C